jgi:hypothetical protein
MDSYNLVGNFFFFRIHHELKNTRRNLNDLTNKRALKLSESKRKKTSSKHSFESFLLSFSFLLQAQTIKGNNENAETGSASFAVRARKRHCFYFVITSSHHK